MLYFAHITITSYACLHVCLCCAQKSRESIELTQFHYIAWPDHGVPEYATGVLSFYRRVRGFHSASKDPMLVHCRLEIKYVYYKKHGKLLQHAVIIDTLMKKCIHSLQVNIKTWQFCNSIFQHSSYCPSH